MVRRRSTNLGAGGSSPTSGGSNSKVKKNVSWRVGSCRVSVGGRAPEILVLQGLGRGVSLPAGSVPLGSLLGLIKSTGRVSSAFWGFIKSTGRVSSAEMTIWGERNGPRMV